MAAKKTFEENMSRLEEIVSLLERGDATLGDSMALFEEGTKLTAYCSKALKTAEQKIVARSWTPPSRRWSSCPRAPMTRRWSMILLRRIEPWTTKDTMSSTARR